MGEGERENRIIKASDFESKSEAAKTILSPFRFGFNGFAKSISSAKLRPLFRR
jgi:hypothetical protein